MSLAISLGDPWGIGPEVVARTLARARPRVKDVLILGPGFAWEAMLALEPAIEYLSESFLRIEHDLSPASPGSPPSGGGALVLETLKRTVRLVKDGRADAVLTAPVNKALIHQIDPSFIGHTEFLGGAFGLDEPTMTFVGSECVTGLVTTHLALKDVPTRITRERVFLHITRLADWLREALGAEARLAVCGLNPHAGEEGCFGDEEDLAIKPAILDARAAGYAVEGPFPADTIYLRAGPGKRFAGVLAMYHDQALVYFKASDQGEGVNLTLGLPFIRTSPDHGTAYDLAGRGQADFRSTLAAYRLAGGEIRAQATET